MLLVIIGESCTGKSTLAERMNQELKGRIYTGKDYLRLAKNETEAKKLFTALLRSAAVGDETVTFVISEKEHLSFVQDDGFKVLVKADLQIIKERFSKRMNGKLPITIETMLEKKHGMFDEVKCDYTCTVAEETVDSICHELIDMMLQPRA